MFFKQSWVTLHLLYLSVGETSSEEEGQLDLVTEEQVTDTASLKPFEITKKPRKRKNKNKSGKITKEEKPVIDDEVVEESIDDKQVRNALYTACKVGDVDTLQQLLSTMTHGPETTDNMATHCSASQDSSQGVVATHMINDQMGDQCRTLLHLVAVSKHTGAVSLLMKHGADPTIRLVTHRGC